MSTVDHQATMALLQVRELTLRVAGSGEGGRPILDAVSFDVQEGEAIGIVGESGSGKSMLVRALLHLLPKSVETSGQISYRGVQTLTASEKQMRSLRGKEIAHILPNPKSQLNPLLKIGDLMAAVIRVHLDLSAREVAEKSAAALTSVGISDPLRRLEAYPHELSGGMAQRVCVALALMHNPRLIVADEPTAGLDVTVQRQVLDLMAEVTGDASTTQVIVTRDLGIVAHYCQRMAVMDRGRLVELGPVAEVFSEPKHPYTRKLLEAVRRKPRQLPDAKVV